MNQTEIPLPNFLGNFMRPILSLVMLLATTNLALAVTQTNKPLENALAKVVKIHGAGGSRGLEAYQSGFLISGTGHVLTVWSYVLDTDSIRVTLDDGRRFDATLVGADPRLEIAVLKFEGAELPHFDVAASKLAENGGRVLALSNLFGVATGDESVSVQRGVVMANTRLDARRGTFETLYHGPVYVLDAMTNNPGAAGGALVNQRGELLGLLGKELRNARNNAWLNYAIPMAELKTSIDAIISGKPQIQTAETKLNPADAYQLSLLGITLVPDVLEHTPPYVDDIQPNSPAAKAGLQPDDLLLFIGDTIVPSCRAVQNELARLERGEVLKLVVKRGPELVEVILQAE